MDSQLQNEEEKLQLLRGHRPVVIWGTLTAGKMALEICREMEIVVCAFGDNNIHRHGEMIQDIPILSAVEIKEKYSKAVIMIGIFRQDTEHMVIRQLKKSNKDFVFISYRWIAYFYEMLVIKRKISDKKKFWELQNDIFDDTDWRYGIDRRIITEYRYKITDEAMTDLEKTVLSVYGVKNLYLIIKTEELTDKVLNQIEKVEAYHAVGHMILITDGKKQITAHIGNRLQRIFFYVKVQTGCKKEFLVELQRAKVLYEFADFSSNMFEKLVVRNQNITEQFIYDTLQLYIKGKKDGKIFEQKKPVMVVQIFNGLANQMLIYLFGKFLERYSGKTIIFDDTILSLDVWDKTTNVERVSRWCRNASLEEAEEIVNETRKRNSFYCFSRAEVAEVFQLPIHLLSDYFDDDTWKLYLQKVKKELTTEYVQAFPLGQILLNFGVSVTIMQDFEMPSNFLNVPSCFCFDTHILEWPFTQRSVTNFIVSYNRTAYFMGVWTMGRVRDWLFSNREYVKKTFQFKVPTDERNIKYMKLIRESDAVMIHIRRGDFVQLQTAVSGQYVKDSIKRIIELDGDENVRFFIFSDDLEWCKDNMEELGLEKYKNKTIFIEGNVREKSYLDMYLMSLGEVLIPSPNSTFSYMALLLSSSIKKCVDALQYDYFYRQDKIGKVEIISINDI